MDVKIYFIYKQITMDTQEYIKANVLEAEEAQEYAQKCLETALQEIEALKKENEKLKREKVMVLKQNKRLQKWSVSGKMREDTSADDIKEFEADVRDNWKDLQELKKFRDEVMEILQFDEDESWADDKVLDVIRDYEDFTSKDMKKWDHFQEAQSLSYEVKKLMKEIEMVQIARTNENVERNCNISELKKENNKLAEDLKRVMKERNYLGDYVGGATSDEEDEEDEEQAD
jgi:hypothetical protein